MKLIVYEHMSGGSFAQQPIPLHILAEGFAMLRSVVSDFRAAGHQVTVLLDERISKLNPSIDANYSVPVFRTQESPKLLYDLLKNNEAAYVIAPESGQLLQSLVQLVEQTGKISLNSQSSAIHKTADKTVLYKELEAKNLNTPQTTVLNIDGNLADITQAIKSNFSYPVIFKPADGTSCSGLSIVRNDRQIENGIAKIKAESVSKKFIIQECAEGEPASVSLLCSGSEAVSVSLNKQNIHLASPKGISRYEGGIIPFDHSLKQHAFTAAEKTILSFTGLKGYVGVDLILTEDKPLVIDVNPRLTTSYVGLSKIASSNVAEAILNAVLKNQLPKELETHGVVCLSKIETPRPTIEAFQKAMRSNEVISPPFPLSGNSKAWSLILGRGGSLNSAREQLGRAKRQLLKVVGGGK